MSKQILSTYSISPYKIKVFDCKNITLASGLRITVTSQKNLCSENLLPEAKYIDW